VVALAAVLHLAVAAEVEAAVAGNTKRTNLFFDFLKQSK